MLKCRRVLTTSFYKVPKQHDNVKAQKLASHKLLRMNFALAVHPGQQDDEDGKPQDTGDGG